MQCLIINALQHWSGQNAFLTALCCSAKQADSIVVSLQRHLWMFLQHTGVQCPCETCNSPGRFTIDVASGTHPSMPYQAAALHLRSLYMNITPSQRWLPEGGHKTDSRKRCITLPRCPGGRTPNDCWLVSERSRVQTQTLTSAYFSLVAPVIYFGTPVDLAGWSSR